MALRKNFSLMQNGFDVAASINNAYIRIDHINGSKNQLTIFVSFYKQNENQLILAHKETYSFNPDLDGKNFISQAYDYLKKLPEFAGANDC